MVQPSVDESYAAALKTWLEADLTEANIHRDRQPWIIAVHHHPEYSSSNHGKDADVLRGRAFFASLWDKYAVDAVFTGHDHNYERTRQLVAGADVDNPKIDRKGTTHVVCAGSGADGYGSGKSAFTGRSGAYDSTAHLGIYGVLEASMTELKWQPYWLDASQDTSLEPETVIRP